MQDELGGGRSLEAGITTRGLPGRTAGRWDGDIRNEKIQGSFRGRGYNVVRDSVLGPRGGKCQESPWMSRYTL